VSLLGVLGAGLIGVGGGRQEVGPGGGRGFDWMGMSRLALCCMKAKT